MRIDMIVGIHLKPAFEHSGCPICTIRNTFEERYLASVLHEYVNDYETRSFITASLGYCPKHAWQMGLMEREKFGDGVGNAIIYENLVNLVIRPLVQYQRSHQKHNQHGYLIHHVLSWLKSVGQSTTERYPEPYKQHIHGVCRVCQKGESTQQNYLEWLLQGLSDPEPELRDPYLKSNGLCFSHFRQALGVQTLRVESGVNFLVDQMLERLLKLQNDLNLYTFKHAFDRRMERMTPDECKSWIQAIRFFAGNEGNLLIQELVDITTDDRINTDQEGLNG